MDLVVFVVFVDRYIVKVALQAVLRVFGLCGSCVVLVWVVLWFLVTCGFWLWSACPIHLMWFLRIGGLALDARCLCLRVHLFASMLDADGCPQVLRANLPVVFVLFVV